MLPCKSDMILVLLDCDIPVAHPKGFSSLTGRGLLYGASCTCWSSASGMVFDKPEPMAATEDGSAGPALEVRLSSLPGVLPSDSTCTLSSDSAANSASTSCTRGSPSIISRSALPPRSGCPVPGSTTGPVAPYDGIYRRQADKRVVVVTVIAGEYGLEWWPQSSAVIVPQ